MTGNDLTTWREANAYTKVALAAALGVDRSTIYRWEQGGEDPPPYLHLALAYLARLPKD